MFTNYTVCQRFIEGKVNGCSNSMRVSGNRLFSYSRCIAIRNGDKFILSNNTSFFGGRGYSRTTTHHIRLVYDTIKRLSDKPVRLVDGWVEGDQYEWLVPESPTHKHLWSLLRSMRVSTFRVYLWIGEWFPKTGTKRVDWEFRDGKLFDPEGNLIAIREMVRTRKMGESGKTTMNCSKACDICPVKFRCLTETDFFWGSLFFIIKGTKYEEYVKRFLHPASIIDYLPTHRIVGEYKYDWGVG